MVYGYVQLANARLRLYRPQPVYHVRDLPGCLPYEDLPGSQRQIDSND